MKKLERQRAKELDSCGIGFVADSSGEPSHDLVKIAIEALARVEHRGAVAADELSADGSGIMVSIPRDLLTSDGVAMIFSDGRAQSICEEAAAEEGLKVTGWRDVPINPSVLGERALASLPKIQQMLFDCDFESDEAERACYRARRRSEKRALTQGVRLYVCSWSTRTVTYKGLIRATAFPVAFPDFTDPRFRASFAIFHQRYSTNTSPTWERAQPMRMLCHNGEINAIAGNENWMRTRKLISDELGATDVITPVIDPTSSDSAMLDNAAELLVRAGRTAHHTFRMLLPPYWETATHIDNTTHEFYRYHASLIEPWDGPAGVVFTDGIRVGACLDRNGLRPLRVTACSDGIVVVASEAGVFDTSSHGSVKRTMLGAGEMLFVDPTRPDPLVTNNQITGELAVANDYESLNSRIRKGDAGSVAGPDRDVTLVLQSAFGFTKEERSVVIEPMAKAGKEQTSSMGDDTSIAALSNFPRSVFNFLKQRFAMVTNPPIDHIRERLVFSLRTLVGPQPNLLGTDTPELLEFESFFLYPQGLSALKSSSPWPVVVLDATWPVSDNGTGGLRTRLVELADQAVKRVTEGASIVVLSDESIDIGRAHVPSLLACGAVHHALVQAGLRGDASIVVSTGDARQTHDFACLLGLGADLISPWGVLGALEKRNLDLGQYQTAIEDGVLKIMSKIGISTLASYRGAQLFDVIGLDAEVVKTCLNGMTSAVSGVGFSEIEASIRELHAKAFDATSQLVSTGYVKWRPRGEFHQTNPDVVDALHNTVGSGTNKRALDEERAAHALRAAVRSDSDARYEEFARITNGREPSAIRDLFSFVDTPAIGLAIPLEEVEPATSIAKRFSTGAISHGAISAEAHETLAVAMNMIGGRANTGEGGEAPHRYVTKGSDYDSNCKIKQIASGRFGVTPEYCAHATELQIKIAQGSKPGEGGQLPGHKVTDEIARLRHTQPGVSLISPPPHHDIYSIEDLSQLIFDLKQVNPSAEVSVKLVSTYGVGTIAAGVVKGLAEVVHISGHDGGTGASPLSSIKNAGLPWEIGLAETQQVLVAEGLRTRVRIRVDGGLKTGRDIVIAALLGADEFSFGTAALLAEGCIMVRTCHRDTCPVGIATQNPELRAKFQGTPEMVAAYMMFVASEARQILASLGIRSIDEAVGRVDLLQRRITGDARADLLDLDWILSSNEAQEAQRFDKHLPIQRPRSELGQKIAADCEFALRVGETLTRSYKITNSDRTVGAELGGKVGLVFGQEAPPGEAKLSFEGTAGQSFGAFITDGIEMYLVGEANDYVGKSMGGGLIVISPPHNDAGEPTLIGNTALYGATGGELFVAGGAGQRFAVRNSGANAVIEAAGMHACEYMTGGWVVILGDIGPNLGAGMTGGQAFLFDPLQKAVPLINTELVFASALDSDQTEIVEELLQRHVLLTGSSKARAILLNFNEDRRSFIAVRPRTDVSAVEARSEGTEVTLEGASRA